MIAYQFLKHIIMLIKIYSTVMPENVSEEVLHGFAKRNAVRITDGVVCGGSHYFGTTTARPDVSAAGKKNMTLSCQPRSRDPQLITAAVITTIAHETKGVKKKKKRKPNENKQL